jgi:hypothetical protein
MDAPVLAPLGIHIIPAPIAISAQPWCTYHAYVTYQEYVPLIFTHFEGELTPHSGSPRSLPSRSIISSARPLTRNTPRPMQIITRSLVCGRNRLHHWALLIECLYHKLILVDRQPDSPVMSSGSGNLITGRQTELDSSWRFNPFGQTDWNDSAIVSLLTNNCQSFVERLGMFGAGSQPMAGRRFWRIKSRRYRSARFSTAQQPRLLGSRSNRISLIWGSEM